MTASVALLEQDPCMTLQLLEGTTKYKLICLIGAVYLLICVHVLFCINATTHIAITDSDGLIQRVQLGLQVGRF